MPQDQETIKKSERNRRHHEQIHCSNAVRMVAQKYPPALRRLQPFPSDLMTLWPISTRVNSLLRTTTNICSTRSNLRRSGGLAPHEIASDSGSALWFSLDFKHRPEIHIRPAECEALAV